MEECRRNAQACTRLRTLRGHIEGSLTPNITRGQISSPVSEETSRVAEIEDIRTFMDGPRFEHISRNYTADDVWRFSSPEYIAYPGVAASDKLYSLLRSYHMHTASTTLGCMDPAQAVVLAPHASSIYVSGWQTSVTQASHRISAPDFASYPYNSVPDAVNRIYRALDWHARKQRQHRSTMTATERASTPAVDLLRPIIADADAGHGGPTSVAQLVQLFIEAGAAGVHLEDQRSGSKRCGHMAGKVLVSTGEHVRRLQTARLQADVMRAGLVLIARTDAEGAMWLDSDEDARDHVFLLGGTSERQRPQRDVLREAEAGGARPETVERLLRRWQRAAGVCTYPACVRAAIEALADDEEERVEKLEAWDALVATLPSLAAMRARASDLLEGEDPWWCAEQCRSAEGFYRITGGEAMCVARARAYAPYADLLWMETKAPLLPQAARFAEQVRSTHPSAMFVYNFSPSFNWAAAGLDEKETAALGPALAKLGYVLQLVSLAGFHVNTLGMGALAKDYAENGVTAYVRQVQQKEAKLGLDTLTHQRWSGAMLTDDMLVTVFGAGTSKSMDKSDANTETQFEPQGQREVVDDGRQES